MRSFVLAACAVTASAVGATLVLTTSPAVAGSPLCPSNVPAYGTVTGTAPFGSVDYWYNDSPDVTRTFRLYSQRGDAALYVFDSSCSTQLCSSTPGGTTTAVCSIDYAGPVQIGVHGSYGTIDYTLEAPLPGGPCRRSRRSRSTRP